MKKVIFFPLENRKDFDGLNLFLSDNELEITDIYHGTEGDRRPIPYVSVVYDKRVTQTLPKINVKKLLQKNINNTSQNER